MDVKKNIGREELVTILKSVSSNRLDSKRAEQFLDYVINAMHFYPDADYLARPVEEIFFNIYGLFYFAESPSNAEARVRAFNPEPEVDGWSSPHTIIYINQRDMPFLVDSLRMALNRRGLNIFTLQSNPVWVVRDDSGRLVASHKSFIEGARREALINIEVDIHRPSELAEQHRDLLSDSTLAAAVDSAFPAELVARFSSEVSSHQLRNEIAATQLANDMVDRLGFTFYFRQMESTGASAAEIVRAYRASLDILGIQPLWQRVEENKNGLSAAVQYDLLHILMRLVRQTTRWLLRNRRLNLNCSEIIQTMTQPVSGVLEKLPELHQEEWLRLWREETAELTDLGVHRELASTLAQADSMFLAVGTVEMALRLQQPPELMARLNFKLGEILSLDWFMSQIVSLNPENRWQDLARESYVDDLECQRRQLTAGLLKAGLEGGDHPDDLVQLLENWQSSQAPLIARWKTMVAELRRGAAADFAMVSVALRELLDLVQASVDATPAGDS